MATRRTALAVLAALAAGCGKDSTRTELPKPDANLNVIANAYTDATQANGRGPANVDQLKKAIANITRVIGGDPDDVLVSPNDGQPYAIVWGARQGAGDVSVIAYERQGKDGKRQVVDFRRLPYYVTDEEFKKLKFPASHRPGQ